MMNVRVLQKLIQNRLRLLGILPVGISRKMINDLNLKFDGELIWTGKVYPTRPPIKFKSLGDIDKIFTLIALEWCANAIYFLQFQILYDF